jgi:dihydrofolate reductase
MHISLDGFVAGPDGQMDWIKVDEEIFDYVGNRIGQSDTALYGRVTYQMMESYWPNAADQPNASKHDIEHSKWYKSAQKLVLSTTMSEVGLSQTKFLSDNISDLLLDIKSSPGSEILLFGSPTATHSLMSMNLIDGYWLFVNPIILGTGIRLFPDNGQRTNLNLLSTQQFKNGVVGLSYSVNI